MDDAVAEAIVRDVYGLGGRASSMASERDRNFRFEADDGRVLVLKVANPLEATSVTDFQARILAHLAATAPEIPVQRVLPTVDGAVAAVVPVDDCGDCMVRLVTYLEGIPLAAVRRGDVQRAAVARELAALTAALADFEHPSDEHDLLWDIANAARLLPVLPAIADPALRALCEAALLTFVNAVEPRLDRLPRQVVHNDFNPHNLIMDAADPDRVAGILDFGDAVRTARVADLAVAASYHVADGDPVERIAAFAGAYHQVLPLLPGEVAILADLVAVRLVTTVAIATLRAAHRPENAAYVLRNVPGAEAGLARLAAVDRSAAGSRIAAACGL